MEFMHNVDVALLIALGLLVLLELSSSKLLLQDMLREFESFNLTFRLISFLNITLTLRSIT